jgi:hypothetical protein
MDAVFLQLKALLEPFGIIRFYTDGWGAYERYMIPRSTRLAKPIRKRSTSCPASGHLP